MTRPIVWCWGLALLLLLMNCGGGESYKDEDVVRVELSARSVLMVESDETYELSAQAFNAAGEVVKARVSWESFSPTTIAVSDEGLLRSLEAVGSSQVVAKVGDIQSVPALVTVAKLAGETLLVDDSQVIEEPTAVDESAVYESGFEFVVILETESTPNVGDFIVSTGDMPISGKITAVEERGSQFLVTFGLALPEEVFEELVVDETIALTNADSELTAELAELYDVVIQDDGTYLYTLKPSSMAFAPRIASGTTDGMPRLEAAKAEFKMGPFKCEADGTEIPLTLDTAPASFKIETDLSVPTYYYVNGAEVKKKFVIQGAFKAEAKIEPKIALAFEGTVECKATLKTIFLPAPGFLALVFGGKVPLGVGFDMGGKLTLSEISLEMSSSAEAKASIGFDCSTGTCEMINTLEVERKADVQWKFPQVASYEAGTRLEATAGVFAFADIAIGNKFLRELKFETFGIKGGVWQTANLATPHAQAVDTGYSSDYKLSLVLKAGLAADALKLFHVLNINLPALELSVETTLFRSPVALNPESLVANVDSFDAGDVITFNVALGTADLDYIFVGYNVNKIMIYRRVATGATTTDTVKVAEIAATEGQSEFSVLWTATDSGDIEGKFFAFVETTALPFETFGPLEVGQIVGEGGDSDAIVVIDDDNLYSLSPDGIGVPTPILGPGGLVPFPYHVDLAHDSLNLAYAEGNLETIEIVPRTGSGGISVVPHQTLVNDVLFDETLEAPNWAPNGQKIAFHTLLDGGHIWTMNPDGTDKVQLTSYPDTVTGDATLPSFSPDSTKIAFLGNLDPDNNRNVYVVNADGTDQHRVSGVEDVNLGTYLFWRVQWSADSARLFYIADGKIRSVAADGSDLQTLSGDLDFVRGDGNVFKMSPDGTKLAYRPDGESNSIWVMNLDGTSPTQVVADQPALAENDCFAWSPDGTKFVYYLEDDVNEVQDIHVVDADGMNDTVIHSGTNVSCVHWAP